MVGASSAIIETNQGYLSPESGHKLLPILLESMKADSLMATDEYRFALLSYLECCSAIFDYEQADLIYEQFLNNIDDYVSQKEEKLGWTLLGRQFRTNYSFDTIQWSAKGCVLEIYYLLKQCHELNPSLRLALLRQQEFGYIYNCVNLDANEIGAMIDEINSLSTLLYPNLFHLREMVEVYHLSARIAENPSISLLPRTQLHRKIKEGVVNPIESFPLVWFMSQVAYANNSLKESHSLMEEAQRRALDIIAQQSIPTRVNSLYIVQCLIQREVKQYGVVSTESDDSEELIMLDSLLSQIDTTIIGNRCKVSAISQYSLNRTGTSVSLPTAKIGRKIIQYVKNDSYKPYRYECLVQGAKAMFNGGLAEESIDLMNQIFEDAKSYPRAAARACRSL